MENLLVNTNLPEVEKKIELVKDQRKRDLITKKTYKNRLKVLNSLKSFLLNKEKLIEL